VHGPKARQTVCVVDDDEAVRDSTRLLLEAVGYEARGYDCAAAFLLVFDPKSAGCLIFDIHMPDMDGLELLAEIRRQGATTPVLIVSGRSDAKLGERARASGALAVLQKPVDDDELLALVEKALDAASK
jgi:FixJ family two-component response regulator